MSLVHRNCAWRNCATMIASFEKRRWQEQGFLHYFIRNGTRNAVLSVANMAHTAKVLTQHIKGLYHCHAISRCLRDDLWHQRPAPPDNCQRHQHRPHGRRHRQENCEIKQNVSVWAKIMRKVSRQKLQWKSVVLALGNRKNSDEMDENSISPRQK